MRLDPLNEIKYTDFYIRYAGNTWKSQFTCHFCSFSSTRVSSFRCFYMSILSLSSVSSSHSHSEREKSLYAVFFSRHVHRLFFPVFIRFVWRSGTNNIHNRRMQRHFPRVNRRIDRFEVFFFKFNFTAVVWLNEKFKFYSDFLCFSIDTPVSIRITPYT